MAHKGRPTGVSSLALTKIITLTRFPQMPLYRDTVNLPRVFPRLAKDASSRPGQFRKAHVGHFSQAPK
jgi:hypothetical protein